MGMNGSLTTGYSVFQPYDHVLAGITTGENKRIDEGKMETLSNPVTNLDAVEFWHPPIQNGHTWRLFALESVPGLLSVGGRNGSVAPTINVLF